MYRGGVWVERCIGWGLGGEVYRGGVWVGRCIGVGEVYRVEESSF